MFTKVLGALDPQPKLSCGGLKPYWALVKNTQVDVEADFMHLWKAGRSPPSFLFFLQRKVIILVTMKAAHVIHVFLCSPHTVAWTLQRSADGVWKKQRALIIVRSLLQQVALLLRLIFLKCLCPKGGFWRSKRNNLLRLKKLILTDRNHFWALDTLDGLKGFFISTDLWRTEHYTPLNLPVEPILSKGADDAQRAKGSSVSGVVL